MKPTWTATGFLTLALTVAVVGSQTRSDGRVWQQPHLDPDRLTAKEVDPLMWPIVERINRSGWIWTTESCQGHDEDRQREERQRDPLLGFVTDDIGRALAAM